MLIPRLHIKLSLIKQFVKQLVPEDEVFKDIQELFPKESKAKFKAGVFMEPRVRRLMNSESFLRKLSEVEQEAWTSFIFVVK